MSMMAFVGSWDVRSALRRAWDVNKPLTVYGVASVMALLIMLAGLVMDPRVITGQPAWLKPIKFAISTGVYSFTVVWLLTFVKNRPRLVSLVGWVTAIGFVVEMAIIITQVIRGTISHFNTSTALDGTMFSMMGLTIVIVWLMGVIVAGLLLVQRLPDAAFAWALRLSLVVALVGMGEAFLMTSMPSPGQRATMAAGQRPTSFGAHSVGVEDGGRGLPVVGWSLEGGDLRVAHFVGLHAMQVLPLAGWWISRRFRHMGMGHRTALVWTAGLGYLGLVLLLTWQALRGQPLVYPDAQTLGAVAGLVAGVALAAMGIVVHGQERVIRRLSATAR